MRRGITRNCNKLPAISVGATENAILAASNAKENYIKNCAIEPEIKDLINFLRKLGIVIPKGRTIVIQKNQIKKQN